jgi:hypothetical protein
LTELVEIVFEFSFLDVHDVIFDLHELFNCLLELVEDLEDGGTQSLTLGITNVDLLEFGELDDRIGQVLDILASL